MIICNRERETVVGNTRKNRQGIYRYVDTGLKKRDLMIPLGERYVLRWALFSIYESGSGEAWVNIDSSLCLRCGH